MAPADPLGQGSFGQPLALLGGASGFLLFLAAHGDRA